MPYSDMIQYREFQINVKPLPLRDSDEWTSHFTIYRDTGDAMEPIQKVHMGNKCTNESEARIAAISEATRLVDRL
jgi:hypothetical protein